MHEMDAHPSSTRSLGHIIGIAGRIRCVVIDRRRDDAVLQAQAGGDDLQRAAGCKRLGYHGLDGTDGDVVGLIREDRFRALVSATS